MRLENLAVRSKGNLILSPIDEPSIWEFDPQNINPNMITSVLGIAEIEPYLRCDRWEFDNSRFAHAVLILRLLTHNQPYGENVRKITSPPDASGLNGMTTLDKESQDIVLIAGFTYGILWRVNITSGEHEISVKSGIFKIGCYEYFASDNGGGQEPLDEGGQDRGQMIAGDTAKLN